MKKCTTCGKTFDDNLKFCQTDGTPLVEVVGSDNVEETQDPYQTIVGKQGGFPLDDTNQAGISDSSNPPSQFEDNEDDILDVPAKKEVDPMQTMVVSPEELRRELDQIDSPETAGVQTPPVTDEPQAETPISGSLPPTNTPPSPFDNFGDADISEPTNFNEPDLSPPNYNNQTPNFDNSPPASPIPSPFDESMVGYQPPPAPQKNPYDELEMAELKAEALNTPFAEEVNMGNQNIEQSDWSPPPAPDANWQDQQIGQNTAFQSPPAASGQNQTLPIVSLVLGIISLCSYISPLTGIAAVITGYLGMKNANNDPANYGGKGLAIAGMITGGIFLLIGLLYWIYIIFIIGFVGLSNLGNLG